MEKMEEILEAIKELKRDLKVEFKLQLNRVVYVTIENNDGWDFSTLRIHTDASQIPYLYSDDDDYFVKEEAESLEPGESLTGDTFKIMKVRIN